MAFDQVVRVISDETDDCDGQSWRVQYALYKTEDDNGLECFDLYIEDDRGNGRQVCRGPSLNAMRSLILRLGEFYEWAPGIARQNVKL